MEADTVQIRRLTIFSIQTSSMVNNQVRALHSILVFYARYFVLGPTKTFSSPVLNLPSEVYPSISSQYKSELPGFIKVQIDVKSNQMKCQMKFSIVNKERYEPNQEKKSKTKYLMLQECSNFESGQNSFCESDQGSIKTQMFICQQTQDHQRSQNFVKGLEIQGKSSQKNANMLINIKR